MEEEGLGAAEAGDAVLRDNLFGLEIDPRCTQIAAFALAWRPGRPAATVPCRCPTSPAPASRCRAVGGLAEAGRRRCAPAAALERLYNLFQQAPTLGSLIDPAHVPMSERMFSADYEEVAPLLERALAEGACADDRSRLSSGERQRAWRGRHSCWRGSTRWWRPMCHILARGKQDQTCSDDIATTHHPRCERIWRPPSWIAVSRFTGPGGSYAIVTPQNWLFLGQYSELAQRLLREQTWNFLSLTWSRAFETITVGRSSKSCSLLIELPPRPAITCAGIDVRRRDHEERNDGC